MSYFVLLSPSYIFMTNVFEWHFLDSPPPHGCNSKEEENEEDGIRDQKDLETLLLLLKDKMK